MEHQTLAVHVKGLQQQQHNNKKTQTSNRKKQIYNEKEYKRVIQVQKKKTIEPENKLTKKKEKNNITPVNKQYLCKSFSTDKDPLSIHLSVEG